MSTLRERNAERLKASIASEKCDAHGVFNFYTFPFFKALTDVDLKEYFHNPQVTLECQIEAYEKLDGIGNPLPDMGAVAEASGLGAEIVFDGNGFIAAHPNPRIAEADDEDDLDWLKPADPWADNYMTRALETLQYMVDNCPKGYKVNPHPIMGPFTVGATIRGISDFCADTIAEPNLVNKILDVVVETQIRFMKEMEKILGSLHHILVADDLSAFLSEPAYREFVLPRYEQLFAEFPNTQRWLHNDSTARHVAPAIADSGMVAWQYLPEISPMDALELTKGKVTLLGGLSPLDLQKWTAEETYQNCTKVLESFNGESKCVLAAGGSINQVPIENLKAMFKAADDYKI
ncbi:MAG TPA: uroporphyrinogen decarboxylase family protein [Anaerovoracaceae bacterium]|nr:uroporphyrinogen decarboxylase family protein [Anaerovoracaceae bacterium]